MSDVVRLREWAAARKKDRRHTVDEVGRKQIVLVEVIEELQERQVVAEKRIMQLNMLIQELLARLEETKE